ncbi:MAG TPA: hypothetical protein DEF45_13345 [Rhodopirellula sp.]|nr:MAG: hypothetical protein CBD74_03720 [Saprospirales bacterium TMED214]HBV63996.1 hypothetical protein [Rhodopirellula sp.]
MKVPTPPRFQRCGAITDVDFTTIVVEVPPQWQDIGVSRRVAEVTGKRDWGSICSEVHDVLCTTRRYSGSDTHVDIISNCSILNFRRNARCAECFLLFI